jgi:hypothetical protein
MTAIAAMIVGIAQINIQVFPLVEEFFCGFNALCNTPPPIPRALRECRSFSIPLMQSPAFRYRLSYDGELLQRS